jgi:hypothetical protein
MDLKKQILVALGLDKEEVNLEFQAKLVDGTIIVSTADELAEGVDIAVLTEDGTTILLPVGEYKTEDGVTFTVEEEGVIAAIGEAEEVEEEVEASEELAEDDGEEADVEDWEGMEKRIQNLEDAVADLKEKLGNEDKEEVEEEEMTEETTEPSTNPKSIKTTEVVEFSAEEEIEKLKAENEKLKTELAAQPAATSVNTNKFSTDKKEVKIDTSKMSKRERILYNITNN